MSDTDHIYDLLKTIRDTQLEQAQQQGAMAAHIEALSGTHGRVTALEHQQARNFWLSVAIAPLLAIAHGVARKFGVNI
jgi:hypothetical protein